MAIIAMLVVWETLINGTLGGPAEVGLFIRDPRYMLVRGKCNLSRVHARYILWLPG
jgi:hypothetical protein